MRFSTIFSVTLLLAACSSSGSSTPDGADAGPSADAGREASSDAGGPDADPGTGVVPLAEITNIVADSPGGGFAPNPPPGSACTYGQQHYEYATATKHLTYKRCATGVSNTDPLVLDQGERDLTGEQVTKLNAAMNGLKLSTQDLCGADKAVYSVTITTASGPTEYFDSFYSCQKGGKVYVDNIDDVFSAFYSFVPQR